MDIVEIRKKRIELERQILDLIVAFESKTEAPISSIELQHVSVVGSGRIHTSSVSVEIKI